MKPMQKVILTIGLIVLICSCRNAGLEPKAKKTESADSIAITKSTENSQRTEAEAKAIIDGLYTRLVNGEDFTTLAKRYSEDPGTNSIGGRYDSVRKDIFVPEFEKVVFNLKINAISTPFLTEYGYHIATVIAIRNDERDVRHILITFKK
ncbi:MAG: peptidyl-prolyl cis-trans isomerase [Bacteroidota bacterium]|nr:peptidyl-prolyl cis-trans isomerase [Bacteroidota bacterium]